MFPKNEVLDKTNCLSSLIGIRTNCLAGAQTVAPPFFIEDIEGFDLQRLAALALPGTGTGTGLGEQIIGSAAREMMGDIELLIPKDYSLQNIAGSQCSSCSLLPVYTSNAGILIKSVVSSSYQLLYITKLDILADYTGPAVLVLNDGTEEKKFNIVLEAGVKMPIKLDYKTASKSVRVYLEDTTIPLGRVSCPTVSSCGCGGSTASNIISLSGLVAGVENTVQYGFIPCVTIGCSYDALICGMVQATPNIFGLALLYKVGEKLTIMKSQSIRNNETVNFQDGQPGELVKNFGQLYWAKLQGSKERKGIRHIIGSYLSKQRADKCVVCETKFYTAGATG